MPEVDAEIDLEDVAAWCLRQKWLGMREDDERWQKRDFFPQLIRLYQERRPEELRREQREKERREKDERMWAEAQVAREKAAHEAWLMRDMREWGRENGHFVGTRGRIPRKVIEAYKEAKGIA